MFLHLVGTLSAALLFAQLQAGVTEIHPSREILPFPFVEMIRVMYVLINNAAELWRCWQERRWILKS